MKLFKIKINSTTLLSTVILLVSILIFMQYNASRQERPIITSEVIKESLIEINELTTVEYHYTKVGKLEQSKELYGWEIPLTQKMFILSYDGLIKVGINLQNLGIKVNTNSIEITMPKAEILSHEIFEDSVEVFDESANIFNQIKIMDFISFTKDNKKTAEVEAIAKGILETTQERSGDIITTYIENIVPERYKVSIETEYNT